MRPPKFPDIPEAGISGLHSRLPRGVRPRLEGKPRTPLSSRVATRVSWSPLSGLKGARVTAGPKRPHLSVCPGPNFPLQGRQGSRGCIPGSRGEPGLVSRGSQGLRSPLESRRGSLGPDKDLESPSSTRLEALVPSRDSRARTRSPSPRACLGFPSRRGLAPRGSLECNPEIPAFPGEEN